MEGIALIQKSDVEYERTNSHQGERVWIKFTSPDGATSADIGILTTSEGLSIDVYRFGSDGAGDGPIIAPWLMWSDLEEGRDADIVDNQE